MTQLNISFPQAQVELGLVFGPHPLMCGVEVPPGRHDIHTLMDGGIEVLSLHDLLVGFPLLHRVKELSVRLPTILVRLPLYRGLQVLWVIPEAEASLMFPGALLIEHAPLSVLLCDPPGLALSTVEVQVHTRHLPFIVATQRKWVSWGSQ